MNCPTADKLSQFVDQLLPEHEMAEIKTHLQSCTSCGKVVNAFQEEQRFIEETLQTPTLPNNFTDLVLDQLESYGKPVKHRRTKIWKQAALTAAGIVLAVGIGATVNPAFAQFIGGLFSSDQVDIGLNKAAEAGLTQKVDLQVEDQGLTFVVEDVIADTSRVTLSYKVLNENGIPQDTSLKWQNLITAIDQNGNEVRGLEYGWYIDSDYGYVEFNLHNQGNNIEKLTIQFDLVELNGVKGKWQLQVPVDLSENHKLTKLVDIKDATSVHHGVEIDLKKLQIAPSSFGLFFETSFTEEEKTKYESAMRDLEDKYGKDKMGFLIGGNTSGISYHIKNAEDEVIYSTIHSISSGTTGMLKGMGEDMEKFGHTNWTHSYIPKNEDQLTFVLDGVYKKELTDIALTIKPKDLSNHPVSIDYKGNHLKVKSVWMPQFGQEKSVTINMDGRINTLNSDMGNWIAVDDKGNTYNANLAGSFIRVSTGTNGRQDARLSLELEGLKEVPEELTLYLVSMSFYYPVEKEWQVPLLGEN